MLIKNNFSSEKQILSKRFLSSKVIFFITSFLFFLNFFLMWARVYGDIFFTILSINYIIVLVSMFFYIYFFLKCNYLNKFNIYIIYIIFFILFLLFFILFLPIILKINFYDYV